MGRDLWTNENFSALWHGLRAHRVDERAQASEIVVDRLDDRQRQHAIKRSAECVHVWSGGFNFRLHFCRDCSALHERRNIFGGARKFESLLWLSK